MKTAIIKSMRSVIEVETDELMMTSVAFFPRRTPARVHQVSAPFPMMDPSEGRRV